MALPPEVLQDIRFQVVLGFDNEATLFDHVVANHGLELGYDGDQEVYAGALALVREAIEAAVATRVRESASWPPATDCDRLRAAFTALERQHIVGLEMPGATQADGIPPAADLAVTRDGLGWGTTIGYCFFTWNDVARAMQGEGLSLAYGTFLEDPEPAVVERPKCRHCNGRGWVPADDPSHGSRFCECQSVPKAHEPEPEQAPGFGLQVGAAVVAACREAGLAPEWTGKGSDFIELPAFAWRRRPRLVTEEDFASFVASWELELRSGYLELDHCVVPTLEVRARDAFEAFTDFGPRQLARLRAHTEAFVEAELEREASWSEATTNDRITAAFAELRSSGVFAHEDLGLTIQDGWGYAGVKAPNAGEVVFFHREDVIDAMLGGALHVAFGTAVPSSGEGAHDRDRGADDRASLDLGCRVVAALRAHGVACDWSESARHRIRIEPFVWRRRRSTEAPPFERVAAFDEPPKRPSFIARLLGRKSAPPAPSSSQRDLGVVEDLRLGETIRTRHDDDRFDLARARRMRTAWEKNGHAGSAQVGHVGVPHAFTPPGAHVAMAPRLAVANLGEERHALFARGARASTKAAPPT